MPCYNYSSNEPIYYEPNGGPWSVEKVYSAGSTYSYASIAIMCELPPQDQLCVYTRASAGATETKLTYGLDYTINKTLERVVLNQPASGQVVIRRCTPNDKMLFKFVDGAKITAGQLNGSLYQLLFLGQEKEWIGATNNHYYPVAANVTIWNSGTSYSVGNYVTLNSIVYQCIQANSNQTPPNATYWNPVNFITNGFVIQGGENLGGPVKFDLSGISNGYGLVWNGTKFEAGTIGGFLDNLQDVAINQAVEKQILVHDGLVWKNYLPSVDIRDNNLKFKDFTFYNRQTTANSYSRIDAVPTTPTSLLETFTDTNGNYVLTHPPTVYHIIKKTIPSEQDPVAFFNNVNTQINNFAASLANPVKVQFYWNLNRAVPSTDTLTDNGGDKLVNYKIAFWDSPQELYHPSMWSNTLTLKYHGILSGTTLYRDNAYFHYNGSDSISKITGKGIKPNGFYLNVPECYNTALCNIPVIYNDVNTFFQRSNLVRANLTSPTSTSYRDEYLTALRDFAFAGVRSGIAGDLSAITDAEKNDHQARYAKSFLLDADYNGWEDVTYKRLEITNDTERTCLFKMPKQMIYYNKLALFMVNNQESTTTDKPSTWPETPFDSNASANATLSKSVRFTGSGVLSYVSNASSSLTENGMGGLYKSDSLWLNWCQYWANTSTVYRFNEADIDWYVSGITATDQTPSVKLWNLTGDNRPIRTPVVSAGSSANYDEINATDVSPWLYRPNVFVKDPNGWDGFIGTHLFNMDSNRIFSDAISFVPDPRDEYVFRIVVKDSLFNTFNKAGSFNIASAIILEHGFDEHPNNAQRETINTTLAEIYRKNSTPRQLQRVRTRLDKNDVKVFVQSEHFEATGTGTNQYVINLCISVPRLKSIGYARVYRRPNPADITGNVYYNNQNTAFDTEIDLGPWTFYLENDSISSDPNNGVGFGSNYEVTPPPIVTYGSYGPKLIGVAGRNECAVKFTRLGIPSNLWIRMSVLNTDGTTTLLSGTTWNPNAT